MSAPLPTLRRARAVLARGFGLGLFLTLFVDVAVLVVPIYDIQLYDRVLLSHNMSTVAMLSFACAVGLLIYAVLDFLRSAVLVAVAEQVGNALTRPVMEIAIRGGVGGNTALGGDALRDLHEVRTFLASGAPSIPLDAICAPLLLAAMFALHPAYGWLSLVGIFLLLMLGVINDWLVRPAVERASKERAQAGNVFASGLRESELTEGLGQFPALSRRWAIGHAAALGGMRRAGNRAEAVGTMAKIARMSLQAGVMALGAVLILSHQASPGSLMGANLLMGKVLGPFDGLVVAWRRWVAVQLAWRRLTALLAADVVACDKTDPDAGEAGLVLRDVSLREPKSGRALLHDIQLSLPPGTAAAVVGPNGAGKSTLLRVMVGLTWPSSGSARLDGSPVATNMPGRVGYLPQGVQLLDGTVWDNIARFEEASPETVIAASSAAAVHDLVGRLRQGYDTRIGPSLPSLSGGQKQRVGLARALFGFPRLLGLDEPDASLDHVGEDALIDAIGAARRVGSVIVVVTHRPRLLAAMDQVITVQAGRIASIQTLSIQTSSIQPSMSDAAQPIPA